MKSVGFFDPDTIEPDAIPTAMPDGIVSVEGSSWSGTHEWHGIVDVKMVLGENVVSGLFSVDQAKEFSVALAHAIKNAQAKFDAEAPETTDS